MLADSDELEGEIVAHCHKQNLPIPQAPACMLNWFKLLNDREQDCVIQCATFWIGKYGDEC
jgi:hypothetical protein